MTTESVDPSAGAPRDDEDRIPARTAFVTRALRETADMVPPMGAQTSASIDIAAEASAVFGMVSDITRMGEWSPSCIGGEWENAAIPAVGAWFVGKNRMGDFEYETRNEVVAFDPPTRLAWVAGGVEKGWARWTWDIAPIDGGSRVTETWELVGTSPAVDALGVDKATENTHNNIQDTLRRLKAVAEAT